MPQSWALVAAPLAAGAVLLRGVLRKGGKRKAEEGGKEAEGGAAFACERVCTSESLLRRLGSLAKARRLPLAACLALTRLAGGDAQHVRHRVRPLLRGRLHGGLPARRLLRHAPGARLERLLPQALQHRVP